MILHEGWLRGKCPEHMVVVRDGLDLDFENDEYRCQCGRELVKLEVLEETRLIHEREVVYGPDQV